MTNKYTQDMTGTGDHIEMDDEKEPERYYEILIKTVVDGNTIIKDDQYYFKVINDVIWIFSA